MEQACCAALVVRSVITDFEKQKIVRVIYFFSSNIKLLIKLSLYLQLQGGKRADGSPSAMDDSMNEWENMSIDMVQWNVLLKQLEDLSALSRLIQYCPIHLRELQRQKLQYFVEDNCDNLEFSLASILQKGRGNVALKFHIL